MLQNTLFVTDLSIPSSACLLYGSNRYGQRLIMGARDGAKKVLMPFRATQVERRMDKHATECTRPPEYILVRVPENLDSVRGLACLLVIALHVVGDNASAGLHLPMTSGWHYVMISIEFLSMPLFTALSGYLNAGRRVIRAEFAGFWSKKLRRLGIPLVCATMIVWLLWGHVYAIQEFVY